MNTFLRSTIKFYSLNFFIFVFVFFITFNDGKPKAWRWKNDEKYKKYFWIKKQLNYTTIKDTGNLFRLEKKTKAIKDRIPGDIKNLFEHEEEKSYYK